MKLRRALISVWDKTGIVDFARALHGEFGIEIISTGGTATALRAAGVPVTLVEDITGCGEMLGGRVKTLHPKIHAAILADRDNPDHMRQLAEAGIEPIDLVVVNLYPFEKTVADPNCTFEQAIEMIDIGGVALLRAAAKNHQHVLAPPFADDLARIVQWLRDDALTDEGWGGIRRDYAGCVFQLTSRYDSEVSTWISRGTYRAIQLTKLDDLRYGENPNQPAFAAGPAEAEPPAIGHNGWPLRSGLPWADLGLRSSVQMSYNNYLDADAALGLCAELARAGLNLDSRAKLHFASPGTAKSHLDPSTAKLHFAPPGTAKLHFAPTDPSTAKLHFAPADPAVGGVSDERAYRRRLPHWQISGATYFVTFSSAIGPLRDAERDAVFEALRYWDGKKLDLHIAVVMPNHVHLLLTPRRCAPPTNARFDLAELLQSIKANSARAINKLRGVHGQVWERESFDRWMRSPDEFLQKWNYIANNPVKEGLAPTPTDYRWFHENERVDPFEERAGSAAVELEERREENLRVTSGEENLRATPGEENLRVTSGEENLRVTSGEENLRVTPGEENLRTTPTTPCWTACFIKHTNACGVGIAASPFEAYARAYLGDPIAAMGGILAVDFPVEAEFAAAVMETYDRLGKPLQAAGATNAPGGFFVEVWIAPSFTADAVAIIRGTYDPADPRSEAGESRIAIPPRKKWGENVRLLAVGDMTRPPDPAELQYRSIAGGMLVQSPDLLGLNEQDWTVVTKRAPTGAELVDLRVAWLICKHTKSNAITLVRDRTLIGNGAGQMSRVMSCRIAAWLARENGHADALAGSVAASDAFFPFADGPRILIDSGVTAIVQPGGSKRDQETIDLCDERGVAMIRTGTRHFRH